jgi:hypothetical protein
MKLVELMRSDRYKRRVASGAAVFITAAAIATYLAVSGGTPTSAAGKVQAQEAGADAGKGVEFVTKSKASVSPTAATTSAKAKPNAKTAARASASPSTSLTNSPSGSGSSGVTSGLDSATGFRSPYSWPFSWDSIWNIPIASTATYASSGITSAGTYEGPSEADYDSVDPSFPVVTLENARIANGVTGAVSVHGDPAMTAGGEWNTCSAFLGSDNATVYQGQTTELAAGGNPSFGGTADATWLPVNIEGAGTAGCHGGSGLSGLGGTLTLADLTQAGPITHALKIALDGSVNYSDANGGFRWPADTADPGYNDSGSASFYGGSNPLVQEGSLLALPPSISPSAFSNPTVARLAQAMQDYGVYIVDNAGADSDNSMLITNYNAWSTLNTDLCATSCTAPGTQVTWSQLNTLIEDLDVVTNNTAATPGGGSVGVSRCAAYAPAFTDGSGAPPAVALSSC